MTTKPNLDAAFNSALFAAQQCAAAVHQRLMATPTADERDIGFKALGDVQRLGCQLTDILRWDWHNLEPGAPKYDWFSAPPDKQGGDE